MQPSYENLPIVLVGYMCSGKSTFGRALAERLGTEFIDLDAYIEQHQGLSISEIFRRCGEAGFRRIESEALAEVMAAECPKRRVIALGGGTPCRPGVMESLNGAALTVYLQAPVAKLVERILLGGDSRPLVAGKSESELTEFVETSLRARHPFYAKARLHVDSSKLETREEIAETVNNFIVNTF